MNDGIKDLYAGALPPREFNQSYYSRREDEMRRTGFSSCSGCSKCSDCRSHVFSDSRYSDRTRSRYNESRHHRDREDRKNNYYTVDKVSDDASAFNAYGG